MRCFRQVPSKAFGREALPTGTSLGQGLPTEGNPAPRSSQRVPHPQTRVEGQGRC